MSMENQNRRLTEMFKSIVIAFLLVNPLCAYSFSQPQIIHLKMEPEVVRTYKDTIYVANQNSSFISVINTRSGQHSKIHIRYPAIMAISRANKRLYVIGGEIASTKYPYKLFSINAQNNRIVRIYKLPKAVMEANTSNTQKGIGAVMKVTPNGKYLVIATMEGPGYFGLLNLASGKFVFAKGRVNIYGIAIDNRGNIYYSESWPISGIMDFNYEDGKTKLVTKGIVGVSALVVSKTGTELFTLGASRRSRRTGRAKVCKYSLRENRVSQCSEPISGDIFTLGLAQAGNLIHAGNYVFDTKNFRSIKFSEHPLHPGDSAFLNGGKKLVTFTIYRKHDKFIRVFRLSPDLN